MSNETMSVCTARKHVECRRTGVSEETCDVQRNVACRATCPKKFATRFWAVGPTCLLKILQLEHVKLSYEVPPVAGLTKCMFMVMTPVGSADRWKTLSNNAADRIS